MLEWLNKVLNDLKMVTEDMVKSAEPDKDVGPEEHIVGTLEDLNLRKLFFVFRRYCALLVERAAPLSEDSPKKLREEILCFKMQIDILKNVFWSSCRYYFPELRDKMSIGLRHGWKIVWIEEEVEGIIVGLSTVDFFNDPSGQDGGGFGKPTVH